MPRLHSSTPGRPPRAVVPLSVAGIALIAAGMLTGCTADGSPTPTGTTAPASTSVPAPTATATVPVEPPALEPAGTAEDNLAFFTSIVGSVWVTDDRGAGRAYIDALTAGGFDKSAMQVTNDTTTLGDAAESIQFSVRWPDGQCLVGQVGPATGEPVTAVLPGVDGGVCLIGATRTIDW